MQGRGNFKIPFGWAAIILCTINKYGRYGKMEIILNSINYLFYNLIQIKNLEYYPSTFVFIVRPLNNTLWNSQYRSVISSSAFAFLTASSPISDHTLFPSADFRIIGSCAQWLVWEPLCPCSWWGFWVCRPSAQSSSPSFLILLHLDLCFHGLSCPPKFSDDE